MGPDLPFVVSGSIVCCWGGALILRSLSQRRQPPWLAVLLWVAFGAGLLVQGLSPHLQIHNGAFQMPEPLLRRLHHQSPFDLATRERWMQAISALLTLGSAIGLLLYYRPVLWRSAESSR
jgi:hypothetical protein